MSNQLNVSASVECGACQASNSPDAKFCAGCGNSLVEPCAKCSKPVLLTQRFCADCGTDLAVMIQKNQDKHEQWMAEAVSNAKQCNYDIAISLMHRVAKSADFRYGDTAQKAQNAVEKIKRLKEQNVGSATAAQEQAETAHAQNDFPKTIKLLSGIPESLMTDDSRRRLKEANSQLGEHAALHGELQSALKAKDWQLVGGFAQQLLALVPSNPGYQNIAKQVSEKLLSSARKLVSQHEYDAAYDKMQSVPACGRNEGYLTLLGSIEDIQSLSAQFEREPFATGVLGRLAVRYAKETPENPASRVLVAELAKAVKEKPAERNLFPFWNGQKESSAGGPIGFLGRPSRVDISQFKEHYQYAGQFNVAIGLALQGLGRSRISQSFAPAKRGLLSSLSRKKVATAWGIDIGSTMMRAVRLQVNSEGVTVAELQVAEFDSPICRKDAVKVEESISRLLKPFIEKNEESLAENPVWLNLPTKDVVHRFTCIPPVKDKQAQQLLDAEVQQRIPLAADEVDVVTWMSALNEDDPSLGRPAIIAATRKTSVQRRLKMFADIGLTVAGMQCDSAALANFVCYEFADEFVATESATKSDGIMLVDCGAAATNVVIVSPTAVFLSCYESGGEDLTAVIARSEKLTLSDADKTKRNPAKLNRPSVAIEQLEKKMAESRQRLNKIVKVAEDQNLKCNIAQTWCSGGGSLCHGWARNVLMNENEG